MELGLVQEQKQVLSPRMQMSLKILQMNSLDLEQHIKDTIVENPLIELEQPIQETDERMERLRKLEWLEYMDDSKLYRPSYYYDLEEERQPLYEKSSTDSLRDNLLQQLPSYHLLGKYEQAARYCIENLDENGYFSIPWEQFLSEAPFSEEVLSRALHCIQSMEPFGVGARDLRECLLIQAKHEYPDDHELVQLIEKHLDSLANNCLNAMAKAMGISLDAVKEARRRLLSLNPKPGNGFSAYNATPYICPDIFVVHFENGFQIILNDYNLPQFTINNYYKEVIKNTSSEAAKYINDSLSKAEWLISCVEQRKKTLLRCADSILKKQIRFFERGPGHMVPMSLADIARDVDIHSSTVSRAVSGKYLQCQWGVFRLSDFFSRSIGDPEEKQSQDMISTQIRHLIDEEDKAVPLSDRQIMDHLQESGFSVARRTVAKYREQMGILSAGKRKEY